MITQQQPDRVSNPLRSNAWTLLYRRNESKSPLEPLLNRRLVNGSAHILDFLHGFIRRSNKATAYRISSGFILWILIASMLHGLHVAPWPTLSSACVNSWYQNDVGSAELEVRGARLRVHFRHSLTCSTMSSHVGRSPLENTRYSRPRPWSPSLSAHSRFSNGVPYETLFNKRYA
jgi:hypothetical protein